MYRNIGLTSVLSERSLKEAFSEKNTTGDIKEIV